MSKGNKFITKKTIDNLRITNAVETDDKEFMQFLADNPGLNYDMLLNYVGMDQVLAAFQEWKEKEALRKDIRDLTEDLLSK